MGTSTRRSKRSNNNSRNNVKLPSWACLVAPKKLVVPDFSNSQEQWLQTKKQKQQQQQIQHRQNKKKNNNKNDLQQTLELEFQQNYARTRLYHLWSRQLDQLVHDFLVSTTLTNCGDAGVSSGNDAAVATATAGSSDGPASNKKRRLDLDERPGQEQTVQDEDDGPELIIFDSDMEDVEPQKSPNDTQQQQLEQDKFQSFAQRFQIREQEPQHDTHPPQLFSSSRLVLPVTIWPQTPHAMTSTTNQEESQQQQQQPAFQHELDRFLWMQTYVKQQRQRNDTTVVIVWLQKPQDPELQDWLEWPKEEIVRQLYLKFNVQTVVRLSQSTWASMTLSELLRTWAQYAMPLLDGNSSGRHNSNNNTPTIQIVWDPQACGFHHQFWEWLVEQRCRHGVPLSVVLLQDAAETLLGQAQRTIPTSCAAQIHVCQPAETATIINGQSHVVTGDQSLTSSWMEQLVEFGFGQVDRHHRGSIHEQSLRVVSQWLWQQLENKSVKKDQENELVPVLLQWKKELAMTLARADLNKDRDWSFLCHDLTQLDHSFSGTWTDLSRRLRFVNLLKCAGEQNQFERYHQLWQSYHAVQHKSKRASLALRLRCKTNNNQVQTLKKTSMTTWTAEERKCVLEDLMTERQAVTVRTTDSETRPMKDCINEWIVLAGNVANLEEYVKCLDESIHQLHFCKSTNVSRDPRQVRQHIVAGLQWDAHHTKLPHSLVSVLTDNETSIESRQLMIACWALRVAPSAMYQTLLTQVSVGRLDWYQKLYQHIQQTLLIERDEEEETNKDLLVYMPQVFQCTLYHLRILGLIKEQRRAGDISYEKVALVFCSGD